MKRFIPFILVIFLGNALSCQSNDKVPDAVKKSFRSKYPNESDPDWHLDKNGNYESNFKKDGKHYKADFLPSGSWIETERSLEKDDLPKTIRQTLKKDFKDFKIVEIEEVQHAEKGLFYDVELKKDSKKKDVEFNKSGNIIN